MSSKIGLKFQKSFNPHYKKKNAINKAPEEKKKLNKEMEIIEHKEKTMSILITKEYLARQLIKDGYVDSYIDFFYLGWKKTPNLKKIYQEKVEEEKRDKNNKEAAKKRNIKIPRHEFNLANLENFYHKLKEAEDALRKSLLQGDKKYEEIAINIYNSIRNYILIQKIPLEAVYFNKKCIDISKMNRHSESLVNSLINMGDCFEKTNLFEDDLYISKKLKEEAVKIFEEKLKGKNYLLEMNIYTSLGKLYYNLALEKEKNKNYKNAIELIFKLLDLSEKAKIILNKIPKNNNFEFKEEDFKLLKIEAYLKIANIYFLLKDYDNTIKTLDLIPDVELEDSPSKENKNSKSGNSPPNLAVSYIILFINIL